MDNTSNRTIISRTDAVQEMHPVLVVVVMVVMAVMAVMAVVVVGIITAAYHHSHALAAIRRTPNSAITTTIVYLSLDSFVRAVGGTGLKVELFVMFQLVAVVVKASAPNSRVRVRVRLPAVWRCHHL